MLRRIEEIFSASRQVQEATVQKNAAAIKSAADLLLRCLQNDGKVLVFGNGGSAADSQHFAAELIGRFQTERKALAAIALTTDTSSLTALGNDYGFEKIFARQLEGLGRKGDVAVAISTSGHSANVVAAVHCAKKLGIATIALTGNDGGELAKVADIAIIVPAKNTARIQESHICVIHALCELVESRVA